MHLYNGLTWSFLGQNIYWYGRWKNDSELIIEGEEREVKTVVKVDQYKVELINLAKYKNPPLYTLMRVDVTAKEKEAVYQDWHHSLPPAIAAAIRNSIN